MTVSYRGRALAALGTLSASIKETERTLAAARQFVTDLLGDSTNIDISPGDLRRRSAENG